MIHVVLLLMRYCACPLVWGVAGAENCINSYQTHPYFKFVTLFYPFLILLRALWIRSGGYFNPT